MTTKYPVTLSVYDLSMGMASQLSRAFTGQQFDGIWHTGIVVYGVEYFFGGGVQHMPAGTTPYGTPVKIENLGETTKSKAEFESFISNQGRSNFRPEQYNLFHNNCNNFTEVCSVFLLGKSIPDYVKGLPTQFLNTPMGQSMRPLIDSMMGNSASPITPNPSDPMAGMGGMNMDMINNMMSNPQIQQMANQFLQGGGMGSMFGQQSQPMYNPPAPQQTAPKVEPEFEDDRCTFRYVKANVPQVINKLKSTLKALPKYSYGDSDDQALENLEKFLTSTNDKNVQVSDEAFKKLSQYVKVIAEKQVFPALDIYRLLLSSPSIIDQQVRSSNSLLHILKEHYLLQWTKLSAPTQLMSMRAIANLVGKANIKGEVDTKDEGTRWLYENMSGIIDIISLTLSFEMDGLRSCSASVAANLALLLKDDKSGLDKKLAECMMQNITKEKVDEVIHRMCLTTYRCLKANPSLKDSVKVPQLAGALQKDVSKPIVRGIIKMITANK